MKGQIELPKLTLDQLGEVVRRYIDGQSVKRIATETRLPYTAVYFYTVNRGQVETNRRIAPVCRCGSENYAGGLCKPCYYRRYRAQRRARVLMAARGA